MVCFTLSCLSLMAVGQTAKKWRISSFGLDMTTYDVPVAYTLEKVLGMTETPSQIEGLAQNKTFGYAQHQNFPHNFYVRLQNSEDTTRQFTRELTVGLIFDMARELIVANLPIVNQRPFYTKDYLAYCLMMDGFLMNAAYGLTGNFGTKWLTWRAGLGASSGLTVSNRTILFSDIPSIHEKTYAAKRTYYARGYLYLGVGLRLWRGLKMTLHYQNNHDFELNHYKNGYSTQTIHVGFEYSLRQKKPARRWLQKLRK